MGVIVAIVNNKGGVGKTTVACNLAHALGLMGKSVLVVDLDSQCNATGLFTSQRLKGIGDRFQGDFPVGFVDCRAQMRGKRG